MVLAADIGNTNIVIGVFDCTGRIFFKERLSTDSTASDFEYCVWFRNALELHGISVSDIEGAIISSVVPLVTNTVKAAIKKITDRDALIVGPGIKTGLSIRIDNPAQLGSDLVVGAVAGISEYRCPLVIIDLGTATTFSVIDKNKSYIGGMIMPGVKAAVEGLTDRTSQLPRIGTEPPKKLICSNTVECMKSGLFYGNACAIDGLLDRIAEELGEQPEAVATGGLAGSVIDLCRKNIIIDDDLMIKGLSLIYYKNN